MYLTRNNISRNIYKYFFNPFMYGLYGLFVFMVTNILLKVFILILNTSDSFSITEKDIALSLLGFFAFFLIKIIRNLKEENKFN